MTTSPNKAALTQKEAEQIARLFNVVFNSAMLYGGSHQTTHKSITPFFDHLTKIIARTGSVSLVIDRESFFCDEWQLDKIINTRRILVQFGKIGIVSITIEAGVTFQEFELFFKYAGDSNVITPVDQITSLLLQFGTSRIKLNYIRYGRITNDQTVVGKNESSATGVMQDGLPGMGSVSPEALGKINEILSLAKLFEHPDKSAAEFTQKALDPSLTGSAVESLANLRQSINSADAPSVDLLLNAVYELKMDLSDAISVQKETGKLIETTEPLTSEMDNLTCDVIAKLVREEFGSGEISLRRLAQIVLRMLPDTNELKRLLPRLKPALLSAGMTLTQYLELVRALNVEFESESLAGTLLEAATGIGATVNELVSAIQSQPAEAARLLVMASELGKGVHDDGNQLSNMLTDYIEKVSTNLALQSKDLTPSAGKPVLREMLEQLEHGLVDQLKKYGVEDDVLTKVSVLLSERRDATFDKATEQWITTELLDKQSLHPHEITDQLMKMITGQAQFDRLHKPLTEALINRGFDKEQMEQMLAHLAGRITSGKIGKLPPGALAPNNMTFLLDREIKCRFRYHTTFSTMAISVEGLCIEHSVRRLSLDEMLVVTAKLYALVRHEVRDIDLVGNLGGKLDQMIFIVMTMTSESGAQMALNRIRQKIGAVQIPLKTGTATIITAASIAVPPEEGKFDLKAYTDLCAKRHHRAVEKVAVQYGWGNS